MIRRSGGVLLLVLAVLVASGCAELPGREVDEAIAVPMAEVGGQQSVPQAWGNLVAVSNSSAFPELFQLWFQDEAGTVRMVVYDDKTRLLKPRSAQITRH